jgi:hypothetical protein
MEIGSLANWFSAAGTISAFAVTLYLLFAEKRRYNEWITLTGIPEDAYRYQLGSRSALEWIIDRYCIKTDKTSGIVNDPNDWPWQVGDPRYLVDLVARIVTVSLEAMQVVDATSTPCRGRALTWHSAAASTVPPRPSRRRQR